jgi:hypothetical protein
VHEKVEFHHPLEQFVLSHVQFALREKRMRKGMSVSREKSGERIARMRLEVIQWAEGQLEERDADTR